MGHHNGGPRRSTVPADAARLAMRPEEGWKGAGIPVFHRGGAGTVLLSQAPREAYPGRTKR